LDQPSDGCEGGFTVSDTDKSGAGAIEIAAAVIVVAFAVTILFVIFSAIAGVVWWTIKMVILIVVLFVAVRWVLRRSTR